MRCRERLLFLLLYFHRKAGLCAVFSSFVPRWERSAYPKCSAALLVKTDPPTPSLPLEKQMGNFSYIFISCSPFSFFLRESRYFSFSGPLFPHLLPFEVYLLYETSCETVEMTAKILNSGSRTRTNNALLCRSELVF